MSVLVTSISGKVPMLKKIKEAVKRINPNLLLHGSDINALCPGRWFVDRFWQCPPIEEWTYSSIVKYCKENDIRAIIPSRDADLLVLASLEDRLRQYGVKAIVSSLSVIELCSDKLAFSAQLKKWDYNAIVSSQQPDLDTNVYVVKERYGAGSDNIGIGLSRREAELFSRQLKNPVFQSYIEGVEYSVDCFVESNGRAVGAVVRERVAVVKGESQITRSVRDVKIEHMFKMLSEQIGIRGHCVFQFIKDSSGHCHIIECNARFGGASVLSIHLGLDSFYWSLSEAIGSLQIIRPIFMRSPEEKMLVRYKEDLIL